MSGLVVITHPTLLTKKCAIIPKKKSKIEFPTVSQIVPRLRNHQTARCLADVLVVAAAGREAAAAGDGVREAADGSRRPVPRRLHSGVAGVLLTGALPARPGPLHTRQSRQQEGPHRVAGETPRGTKRPHTVITRS